MDLPPRLVLIASAMAVGLSGCGAIDESRGPSVRAVTHPNSEPAMGSLDLSYGVRLPAERQRLALEIPYHPRPVTGMDLSSLEVVLFDSDQDQFVRGVRTKIDTEERIVAAEVTRSGNYSVVGLPRNIYATQLIQTFCGLPIGNVRIREEG